MKEEIRVGQLILTPTENTIFTLLWISFQLNRAGFLACPQMHNEIIGRQCATHLNFLC